jgi:phosphoenolpyruvate carboxykinase (ATP)
MQDRLAVQGIRNVGPIYWNLSTPELVEHAVRLGEGQLADNGALLTTTGKYTGRTPQDKFIVEDSETRRHVNWGSVNKPFDPDRFDRLYQRLTAYLQGRPLFIRDCLAGADPRYSLRVRVVNTLAWHNLFCKQLLLSPARGESGEPEFTMIDAPGFQADPETDGTRTGAFIILNMTRRIVIIGGTEYAGEMKKSVFSLLNYLLPLQGVMPMHCSANVGPGGDVALFFGLSGTGKTTLSADPQRRLIGDDEHGWSDTGVFNFEGGCYAKCIRLSAKSEPQIWAAIRFGTVLENVVAKDGRHCDFDDESLTENTRAAYPVDFIPGGVIPGVGGHASNVVFLTADAFGVLPPVSKLTTEQAMYYFLSGYTAKVAGTETGVREPQATFSTCFGAPFLPLFPSVYANLLGEKLRRNKSRVWLLNTGWSGGAFGVGQRIHLPHTRAMVTAALSGELEGVATRPDPLFGVEIPVECPRVPAEILDPRKTWRSLREYEATARDLAGRFHKNFQQFTKAGTEIREAGPRVEVAV